MKIILGVICIFFGIVDLIALIWFMGSHLTSHEIMQSLLIITEFYLGFMALNDQSTKFGTNVFNLACVLGMGLTIFSIVQNTTFSFGVDWAAVFMRMILLGVFISLMIMNIKSSKLKISAPT